MVPLTARIKAHDIVEFGKPSAHQGEEFIYVLEGTIEVHSQFYAPVTVGAGRGIYLDSTMEHAYTGGASRCRDQPVPPSAPGASPVPGYQVICLLGGL